MHSFRKLKTENQKTKCVVALLDEMFRPAHFFLGPELELEWEQVAEEELVWEVFRGRLLDPAHTRQRRTFAVRKAYATLPPSSPPLRGGDEGGRNRSGEPLLALYYDAESRQLYIVRSLDSYIWEGYDAGGNVYLSRERRKWVRELVCTLRFHRFADVEELRDELACWLFQAVVGTSRLPLSSVETPLPAFSFGQLFYCYRPNAPADAGPVRGWRGLLEHMLDSALNPREEAHFMETFLHAARAEEMQEAAPGFVRHWSQRGRTLAELLGALRTLFNEVSLSPYTDLVEKTLLFLRVLEAENLFHAEYVTDFLSFLLRHIGRHLTAFDLVLFHHRGANYPDALLLDSVVKDYLSVLDRRPDLFLAAMDDDETARRKKRVRRRALRQGWLLRRRYEGHAVPDLPTSPGENMRVLPPSHPRVPEEQITQPAHRARQLYADVPLLPRLNGSVAQALRQSFLDLEQAEEWRELGLGVFLDRPFGAGKAAAEPDSTLLLSAEAFSISIARQRLLALAADLGVSSENAYAQQLLARPSLPGLPLDAIGSAARPGTVSLSDARRAAADFVFLRNTPSSVRAFLGQYDFASLKERFRVADLLEGEGMLIAQAATSPRLVVYDMQLRPRLELEAATQEGYDSRAGQEYPVGGLLVRWVKDWMGRAHSLDDAPLRLLPR